jgi:hypothetical protein
MSVCVARGTHSEMDSHEVDGLRARRAQVVTVELTYLGVVSSSCPGVAPWMANMVACRPEVGAFKSSCILGEGGFGCSVGRLPLAQLGWPAERCDVALLLHESSSISGKVAEPQGAVLPVPAWPFVGAESPLS